MEIAGGANATRAEAQTLLATAELPEDLTGAWLDHVPELTRDFMRDRDGFSRFWLSGEAVLAKLPPRPGRKPAAARAAAFLHAMARAARERFLGAHAATLYAKLTRDRTRFLRADRLVYDAAALVPGLVPTREAVAEEGEMTLSDKDGIEIDQSLLLAHLLADEAAGRHLCHAMLLPLPEAAERLAEFHAAGRLDLGAAALFRRGKAVLLELRHPRFLNAEDDTTMAAVELAVDIAILDPESEVAVLRGGIVEHPKYAGSRVFCSGINLTHLYFGKIPYLWYPLRELGFVNKLYRGLATEGVLPDDITGRTLEKPWIAAVEAFAIGGGCQYLLTMDYVIAGSDAYLTLPARKEGIIPGAANLRLPRFVGDRIARQAILYERRIECDSPAGRLLCDEIVAPEAMDAAIDRVVAGLTSSGTVSMAGNRRAIRIAQEPLDTFRRYMAVYAREQALCHFSPALIANLERHWNAKQRRV